MGIEAKCGRCAKQYAVPDNWAGKRVQCPRCGTAVKVPVPVMDGQVIEDDADPFRSPPIERPGASNPFASSSSRVKRVPDVKKPRPLSGPAGQSESSVLSRLSQGPKLLMAVGVGMGLVLLWTVLTMAWAGFGFWLIPPAFLMTVGGVILAGGVTRRSIRRDRSEVKDRAVRLVVWFFGGVLLSVVGFAVMLVLAKLGNPIPSAVNIGSPFLLVGVLVSLVSALVLVYQILILLFPKANIFRIAGIGYVTLTFVIPPLMILILIGLMRGKAGVEGPDDRNVAVGDEPRTPVFEPPRLVPPGRPSIPPAFAPPTNSPHTSPRDSVPQSQRSVDASGNATSPSFGRFGPSPGLRPMESPLDAARGPGRSGPNSALRGPGFRGPPIRAPGAGPGSRQPPSFESGVARLASRFGKERIITVLVDPVDQDDYKRLTDAIQSAAGSDGSGYAASLRGGLLQVAVGPVSDIHAYAARLDIGEVVNVDVHGRTITVEPKAP